MSLSLYRDVLLTVVFFGPPRAFIDVASDTLILLLSELLFNVYANVRFCVDNVYNDSSSLSLTWHQPEVTELRYDDHGCPASPLELPATPAVPSAISGPRSWAAKLLKCPCCNWHYKYRETLEIHMREKHAATAAAGDDDTAAVDGTDSELAGPAATAAAAARCPYCSGGAGAHPRLARGETYPCGYKPYRCDICHYSTTTKGNLSIHMQSDRHVNNVQVSVTACIQQNAIIIMLIYYYY